MDRAESPIPPDRSVGAIRHLRSIGEPHSLIATFARESATIDPRTGRLFAFGIGQHVFDGASLALERSGFAPWYARFGGLSSLVFDPDRLVPMPPRRSSFRRESIYWVVDTDTGGVVLRTGNLPLAAATPGGFIVAPRPAAPTTLAAAVAGASVQRSWASVVSNATTLRYLIEAGSAPGLANLATFDVGLQTALSVGAVPPGTYYVRVRAANYTGTSTASNEIIVTVP